MEKTSNERIEVFNDKLKEAGKNLNWSYSFLQHIMEFVLFCYVFIMLDPESFSNNIGMYLFLIIFFYFALYGRLGPLLYIKEKNQVASTLKKLRYVPVDKKAYRQINRRVLVKYLKKLVLIFLAEQVVLGYLFMGKVSLWNILVPFGLGVIGLLVGSLMINEG